MRIVLPALCAALLAPAAARADTFGIVGKRAGSLVRMDPVQMRPVGRRVPMAGYLWGRAWAPDGYRLAAGVSSRGRIQIVDTRRMRTLRVIQTARRVVYPWIVWASDERLLAWEREGDQDRIAVVDPSTGVGSRVAVSGRALDVEGAPGGLAALMAPVERVGEARLLIFDGALREVALPGIRAGHEADDHGGRVEEPSLTVGDGRAFVISSKGDVVVEIDLDTGTVTSHPLGARAAKVPFAGSVSHVEWLRNGRLAITGYTFVRERGTIRPHGVKLVDTTTWGSLTLARTAGYFHVAGGRLLVDAGRVVRAFHLDGRHAWRRHFRRGVSIAASGAHAFLVTVRPHRRLTVDATTGRLLSKRRTAGVPILIERP